MPEGLDIKVTAAGAQQAAGDLRGVAEAERKVGAEADHTQAKAGRLSGAFSSLFGVVKQLAAPVMGIGALIKAISILRQELEEIDRVSRRTTESLRGVLSLSTLGRARPEEQKAVYQFAMATGAPVEQAAQAYYTFLGGTAMMTPERRQELLKQAALMYKTDPTASLSSLVGLFSTIGTQQPQMAAQQIGNLVSTTIEQAKSTPEEMAQYLPSILTTAKAGKADIGTAAAMFSFATRAGGGVATSGTAVRATLLGLLATPDVAEKQLARYGFNPKASLQEKVMWLAKNGSRLPPEVQAALGGRRGIEAVASIAAQPQEFQAEMGMMAGAMAAPGSLLEGRLAAMYGEVPAQRSLEQIKQLEVMKEISQTKEQALVADALIELEQEWYRRIGVGPIYRGLAKAYTTVPRLFDEGAVRPSSFGGDIFLELLKKGYEPKDIAEILFPWAEDISPVRAVTTPKGEFISEAEDVLRQAGRRPLQGDTYQGGTHYHGQYSDPAGKPREPAYK